MTEQNQQSTDRNRTLTTYVGDLHALLEHMLEPFERQLDLTKDSPEAREVVQQLVDTTRKNSAALDQRVKELGHTEKNITDSLKTGIAELFGVAAGVIDAVRPQQVSKSLRDDYTVTNHAIIASIMLQTTALALNDQKTADLASDVLSDFVGNAQAIASVMPTLVIQDISDDVDIESSNIVSQVTTNQKVSSLFRSVGGGVA